MQFKWFVFGLIFVLSTSRVFGAGIRITLLEAKTGAVKVQDMVYAEPLESVGALSLRTFEKWRASRGFEFEGDDHALVSVGGVKSEMELISDSELKGWGWCFAVNGVVPDDYADKILVTEEVRSIEWFYGYAHYVSGVWTGMCLKDRSQ